MNTPVNASLVLTISGTWVATLAFEASVDGTSWFSIPCTILPQTTTATSTSSNGSFGFNVGGFLQVRVRASAFTSGTVSIIWNSDSSPNPMLSPRILAGSTDGSTIGNTGDRLKVDASVVNITEWPTFTVYGTDLAIGTNKSMMSLVNTTGSTIKVRIREIRLVNTQDVTAVTGVVAEFLLLRCTSHSAGTLITPSAHDSSEAINGSVTARTGATITGEATSNLVRAQWSTDEWGVGTLDQEGFDHGIQVTFPLYTVQPKCRPITLNANEGITLKQITASTVGTFDVVIVFTQET